jgi:hypothetical protein
MSWIQENKFVAGLAGATAVVGGAILFFSISQGSAYEKKLNEYKDLQGQYAQLEKAKPYPVESNLTAREDGIADYNQSIKEVRDLVAGYRPEKLEKMTPEQFKDVQVKMKADLYQIFEDAGTELPEDCLFGFEKYNIASVRAGATAKLNYELGAIQWLLTKLAETKPESISNIRRKELPEETGQVAQPETAPRRGARKGRSGRGARGGQGNQVAAGRAYELMPVELTFTASESSVRDFLVEMVNSKAYYYAIRGVRVRNEKQIAPSHKDANFPADIAPAPSGGFGAFDDLIDGGGEGSDAAFAEEPADGAVTDAPEEEVKGPVAPVIPAGELVLKQILGSEKLQVHLSFDIVLIEKKATTPNADSSTETSN